MKDIQKKSEYYILVQVSDGMFSREYTVNLELSDGNVVSFFVDRELVIIDGNKYKLKVTLIKRDEKHNTDLVLLPTETFETSSRWVTVNAQ